MARLHAYGGDNGTRELDALDTVDLQALQLARDWGVNGNGHKEGRWTFSPCPRPGCGRPYDSRHARHGRSVRCDYRRDSLSHA